MSDLTPRTEAGKRLLTGAFRPGKPADVGYFRERILAIEAEARNPEPIPDTPSLREAARRLVDKWFGSKWEDSGEFEADMRALRAALDPEAEAEPPEMRCPTCNGVTNCCGGCGTDCECNDEAEAERNFSTRSIKG